MSSLQQMPLHKFAKLVMGLPPAKNGVITLESDTTYDLSDTPTLRESEWREALDSADLSDEEREAAAQTLRRMGPRQIFTGIDFTAQGVGKLARAMNSMVHSFGRTLVPAVQRLGRIIGQHHDLVIMDDHVNWPARWPHRSVVDRLDALDWYHATIHTKHLKHLLPAIKPLFPPKVEGETVVPQLARVCVDPQETRVGPPIWPYGHVAPFPPDRMPEPGTPAGHPRRAAQPPPRRTLGHSGRGRTRKQRR